MIRTHDVQNKGNVGLYEPESKPSSNGNGNGAQEPKSTSQNGNGTGLQTSADIEKAIGQLPPEQQQQLGRLYMFLTQHPEAKVELQSLGDVRRAMDNYQVCRTLAWNCAMYGCDGLVREASSS